MSTTPKRRGRKSLLTPELTAKLCEAIEVGGLPYSRACDLVGLSYDTFRQWMMRGEGTHPDRAQTPEYEHFATDIKEARARRDARYVKVIEDAAVGGTWQAAAWFLERTDRREFGRHESVEMTGKDGGPIKQQVTGDEQREQVTALIDELAARRARKDAA